MDFLKSRFFFTAVDFTALREITKSLEEDLCSCCIRYVREMCRFKTKRSTYCNRNVSSHPIGYR